MNNTINTFGDYAFPYWVPDKVQQQIKDFWGCFGRTHKDWIENSKINEVEFSGYRQKISGFGAPPLGATADFFFKDYKLSKEAGRDVYRVVRGRYIHVWNNMGRLIDEYGEAHYPSTCDRWVRIDY